MKEISAFTRLFQLGLISDNIMSSALWVQQIRNVPALLIDVGPPMGEVLIAQRKKMKEDLRYNTTVEKVLQFSKKS